MNKQVKVIPRRDRVEKWEYYNPILKRQELVKVFFPDGTLENRRRQNPFC